MIVNGVRVCTKCKQPGEFYASKNIPWCKACFREYYRNRVNIRRVLNREAFVEKGRKKLEAIKADPERYAARLEYHREYQRQHRDKNRAKHKAHAAVQKALKAGVLVRLPCLHCGDPISYAHHPDYDKPLDVAWLCKSCHQLTHSGRLEVTKPKTVVDEAKRMELALSGIRLTAIRLCRKCGGKKPIVEFRMRNTKHRSLWCLECEATFGEYRRELLTPEQRKQKQRDFDRARNSDPVRKAAVAIRKKERRQRRRKAASIGL